MSLKSNPEYAPQIVRATDDRDFAATAARLLWAEFEKARAPLVILPTGSTPLGVYRELLAQYSGRKDVWDNLRYLALDEYCGLPESDRRLFAKWLERELLGPAGVPESNRFTFNSMAADPEQEAARMETWIAANGPPDIAVLGLGANGHIGFNEPGSDFSSVTRTITLSEDTRETNAKYWGGIGNVPESAYTLGLATIAKAKKIFLLVSGAHKAEILDRVLNGPITPDVPASILRTLPNVTIIADSAALLK